MAPELPGGKCLCCGSLLGHGVLLHPALGVRCGVRGWMSEVGKTSHYPSSWTLNFLDFDRFSGK